MCFLLALIRFAYVCIYFCDIFCGWAKHLQPAAQEGLHARYSDHMEQERAESGILSFLAPMLSPDPGFVLGPSHQ